MATGSKLKNTVTDFSLNPMSLDHVRVVPGNKEGFFVRKGGDVNQPNCCRLCALLHWRHPRMHAGRHAHTHLKVRLSMCRRVTVTPQRQGMQPVRTAIFAFAVPGATNRAPLTTN